MDRFGSSLDCPCCVGHLRLCICGPDSAWAHALHASSSNLQLGADAGGSLSLSAAEYAEHFADQS
eukprot:10218365-Lingulodinium_polyedra.AAC.1